MKPNTDEVYEVLLTDKDSVPNVHISQNNILHVLFPLIGAFVTVVEGEIIAGIASDNTCQTRNKQTEFAEKMNGILQTLVDELNRSAYARVFFKQSDPILTSLITQTKDWQEIVAHVISDHISVHDQTDRPLSIHRGRQWQRIVEEEMKKKDSRLKYFLIKPKEIDGATYGDDTNPTCTFQRGNYCPVYTALSDAIENIFDRITPAKTINIKKQVVTAVLAAFKQKAHESKVAITPKFLREHILKIYADVFASKFPPGTPNPFVEPDKARFKALQDSLFSYWPDSYDYPNVDDPIQESEAEDYRTKIITKVSPEAQIYALIEQVPGILGLDDTLFELTDDNAKSALSLFDKYFKPWDSDPPTEYRPKTPEQKKKERKIDNLCILIQIFVASVGQYAVAAGYTERNFGDVLENNQQLRREFVARVSNACATSLVNGVEEAICDFINKNQNAFGLTQKLTPEVEIPGIIKRFDREIRFIWNEETPHFDEFMRLMKSKRSANQRGWDFFLYFKAAFCFNLLSALMDRRFASDTKLQRLLTKVAAARTEVTSDYQSDILAPSNHWNDVVKLNRNDIEKYIRAVLNDQSDRDALKLNFLLCKITTANGTKDRGDKVFELLPNAFYEQLRRTPEYQRKLNLVGTRITKNKALLLRFQKKVSAPSLTSIQLTPDLLDALNAARFHRKSYFGKYDFKTIAGIEELIEDLRNLGLAPETASQSIGYDVFKKKEKVYIYSQPDGSFTLESNRETIDKLNEISRSYKDIRIVTMPEISSVYKHLQFNNHPDYAEMDKLLNNIPVKDQTQKINPLKIMRAFQMEFQGAIEIIGMNATENTLEWLSETNGSDGRPKKGGAGCMGRGRPQAWKQLQDIHNFWRDKWPLTEQHEAALIQAVRFQCPDFYDALAVAIAPNTITRELQLKCALDLFDIDFSGLYFENNQAIVEFDLRAQSKLKYVLHSGGFSKQRLPLNGDDFCYWGKDYTPTIVGLKETPQLVREILQKQTQVRRTNRSSIAKPPVLAPKTNKNNQQLIQRPLTPEISSCLYLAWLDRIYPTSNDIMQYMAVGSVNKYLTELAQDAHTNRYSAELAGLQNCRVESNSIVGTQSGLNILDALVARYRNTVHSSILINIGLYQQLRRVYGEDSPVYKYINDSLVNNFDKNHNAFTKSHKVLACLYALNLALSNFRFNSECNDLPEKKGGFGNLGEAEKNTENVIGYIQAIPEVCAHDVTINLQTEIVIQDVFNELLEDTEYLTRPRNREGDIQYNGPRIPHPQAELIRNLIRSHEIDANGKPKTDIADRLAALEIRLLLLGFSCTKMRLTKPDDVNSEVIVTLNDGRNDGARLKWFTQYNPNHGLNLRGVRELREKNREDDGILAGYLPKYITVADESLRTLQALRTIKNTWPICPPHVPIKYTQKPINMEGLCPNADGTVPALRTLQDIQRYVATLPTFPNAAAVPPIPFKRIMPEIGSDSANAAPNNMQLKTAPIQTNTNETQPLSHNPPPLPFSNNQGIHPNTDSRSNYSFILKLLTCQIRGREARKAYAVLLLAGIALVAATYLPFLSTSVLLLKILGSLGIISTSIGVTGLLYHSCLFRPPSHDAGNPNQNNIERHYSP